MSGENQPASSAKKKERSRLDLALAAALPRLKVLVPLAIATVLMIFGFFLLWQSSLAWSEHGNFEAAENARTRSVEAIAAQIRQFDEKALEIAHSEAVQTALGSVDEAGVAAAAAAMRAAWPELVDAQFYAADLLEVRKEDLKPFG